MQFVHIADVHIGMSFKTASFAKSFGKRKRDAIMKNVRQVIDHIKQKNIEVLLIAGDFLESDYVELTDLYDLNYLFQRIPETRIYMMTGNHDPLMQDMNLYEKVEWADNVVVFPAAYHCVDDEKLKLSVISVSWDSKGPMELNKKELEAVIASAAYDKRILMLHGDCYNDNQYLPMDPTYLNSLDVDYVALGHIHKSDRLGDKVAYSGSLEPLDFSESYPHGYFAGDLTEGNLTLEFIESMVHPMTVLEVDVTGLESMMAIQDRIQESVSGNQDEMVRIRLIGEKHMHLGSFDDGFEHQLQESLASQVAYVEIKDKTVPGYDLDQLKEEHEDDLIGYFIRSMEEKGLDDPVNEEALTTGITLLLEALG